MTNGEGPDHARAREVLSTYRCAHCASINELRLVAGQRLALEVHHEPGCPDAETVEAVENTAENLAWMLPPAGTLEGY